MRVALIAPEFLPNWGGVGTYCVELARHLSKKRDLDVHIITLERNIKGSNLKYTKEEMIDYFDGKIDVHILTTANDTFLYNAKFQYQIYRQMPKLNKEYKFDLIHSQHAHMSDILLKFEKPEIPSLTTFHTTILSQRLGTKQSNLPFRYLDQSEKYTFGLCIVLLNLERFYLRKTENAIFVSRFIKNLIDNNYKCKFKVSAIIHIGVDTTKFSPNKKNDAKTYFPSLAQLDSPIVLFSGRLIALKGIHVIIRAMREIVNNNHDVHFVFAGDGTRHIWINLLKKQNISPKYYTFLGQVDYHKMPYLYALSSIYILPSFSESWPLGVLEAMSCEKPVIASSVGGIPEIIDDGYNGLLMPVNDSSALSKFILQLLDDDKLRMTFGENARKTVLEKFTWEKVVEKTLGAYKRVAEM